MPKTTGGGAVPSLKFAVKFTFMHNVKITLKLQK
jgi:hypothetical protein